MKYALFPVAVAALTAMTSPASGAQQPGPVHQFRTVVVRDAVLFSSDAGTSSGVDTAMRGEDDLKRLFPQAMAAAGDHAELRSSIKALYVSAKTYFDTSMALVPLPKFDPVTLQTLPQPKLDALRATQARLRAQVDSDANTVQMEASLVGIDG